MPGMSGSGERCRTYLITPPKLDPLPFADRLAAALDAGDVAAVQLRLKDVDDDSWRRAIDVLRPVTQSRNAAFLLNDRADLCQGHRLRRRPCRAGRHGRRRPARCWGTTLTLGMTCKGSRDLAMQAGEDGADYVAFGAFFPVRHQAGHQPGRPGDPAPGGRS